MAPRRAAGRWRRTPRVRATFAGPRWTPADGKPIVRQEPQRARRLVIQAKRTNGTSLRSQGFVPVLAWNAQPALLSRQLKLLVARPTCRNSGKLGAEPTKEAPFGQTHPKWMGEQQRGRAPERLVGPILKTGALLPPSPVSQGSYESRVSYCLSGCPSVAPQGTEHQVS